MSWKSECWQIQVRKDFPDTEERRNYLDAYWASRLSEFKKSKDYKREVALVAGPFLHLLPKPAVSSSSPMVTLLLVKSCLPEFQPGVGYNPRPFWSTYLRCWTSSHGFRY
ncbi:UNVERIFIED_CONTAM: hypothetical protein Sangu_1440800 [Sesamum angustifolium]|uniref:Uncharacterized protein n=1 Tax=Sesamum angustifolium TaxID=2727405 RepID=A0AAW2N6P5_9LAMI